MVRTYRDSLMFEFFKSDIFFLSFFSEENSYYGTHQSTQSYYPSTSVKRVDRRGQSALHKVIGKIKSVFTNVRRSFDTFSLQTVIRRVRDFFSVINRRYSNTYGSSSIVSTLSKVNRRYDNTIR